MYLFRQITSMQYVRCWMFIVFISMLSGKVWSGTLYLDVHHLSPGSIPVVENSCLLCNFPHLELPLASYELYKCGNHPLNVGYDMKLLKEPDKKLKRKLKQADGNHRYTLINLKQTSKQCSTHNSLEANEKPPEKRKGSVIREQLISILPYFYIGKDQNSRSPFIKPRTYSISCHSYSEVTNLYTFEYSDDEERGFYSVKNNPKLNVNAFTELLDFLNSNKWFLKQPMEVFGTINTTLEEMTQGWRDSLNDYVLMVDCRWNISAVIAIDALSNSFWVHGFYLHLPAGAQQDEQNIFLQVGTNPPEFIESDPQPNTEDDPPLFEMDMSPAVVTEVQTLQNAYSSSVGAARSYSSSHDNQLSSGSFRHKSSSDSVDNKRRFYLKQPEKTLSQRTLSTSGSSENQVAASKDGNARHVAESQGQHPTASSPVQISGSVRSSRSSRNDYEEVDGPDHSDVIPDGAFSVSTTHTGSLGSSVSRRGRHDYEVVPDFDNQGLDFGSVSSTGTTHTNSPEPGHFSERTNMKPQKTMSKSRSSASSSSVGTGSVSSSISRGGKRSGSQQSRRVSFDTPSKGTTCSTSSSLGNGNSLPKAESLEQTSIASSSVPKNKQSRQDYENVPARAFSTGTHTNSPAPGDSGESVVNEPRGTMTRSRSLASDSSVGTGAVSRSITRAGKSSGSLHSGNSLPKAESREKTSIASSSVPKNTQSGHDYEDVPDDAFSPVTHTNSLAPGDSEEYVAMDSLGTMTRSRSSNSGSLGNSGAASNSLPKAESLEQTSIVSSSVPKNKQRRQDYENVPGRAFSTGTRTNSLAPGNFEERVVMGPRGTMTRSRSSASDSSVGAGSLSSRSITRDGKSSGSLQARRESYNAPYKGTSSTPSNLRNSGAASNVGNSLPKAGSHDQTSITSSSIPKNTHDYEDVPDDAFSTDTHTNSLAPDDFEEYVPMESGRTMIKSGSSNAPSSSSERSGAYSYVHVNPSTNWGRGSVSSPQLSLPENNRAESVTTQGQVLEQFNNGPEQAFTSADLKLINEAIANYDGTTLPQLPQEPVYPPLINNPDEEEFERFLQMLKLYSISKLIYDFQLATYRRMNNGNRNKTDPDGDGGSLFNILDISSPQ